MSQPYKWVPFADRLPRFIEQVAGHWLWTGSLNNRGYGVTHVAGRRVYAHRAAYALYRGPIPEGLTIDHLCRVSRCVNPDHLEVVTMAENIRRAPGWQRGRTRCPRGHSYTGSNLGISKRKDGRQFRFCRTCHNAQVSAYKSRKRAAA